MTNETKEILDKLNNSADHYILYDYEIKPLLDYITNLQEENKRKDRLITQYGEGMCAYANRIDKANQLIEKQKKKMYKSRNKIAMYILMNLENILRGDE